MKQIVDRSEAKRADLAEAEKSLAALMTSQAVSKSSYTQVASDHEASGRAFADELKALAEATQVLKSDTGGADGQTYSLFRKIQVLLCRHRQISRVRYGDNGQTAREQGAFCCARSAGIAHLCNHEVWCQR